jgi:hypothetical protein
MIDTQQIALAPDPVLPARDALLDVAIVAERLRWLDGRGKAAVTDCTLVRVNYQVGKSLRAVYRAMVNDTPRTIATRMLRHGKSADVFAQTAACAFAVDDLDGVARWPELECVAWLFPNDRKIKTLRELLDADAPHAGGGSRYRLAAYAPEKSATFACADRTGRAFAYAKVTAAHQAARDYQTYCDLQSTLANDCSRLLLPRPLAHSERLRTLWLEAIEGRRLADTDERREADDMRRFGAAVAAFHGLRAPGAPSFDRFSAERLSGDAAIIGRVRPDVAAAAGNLADRLRMTAPVNDAPPVTLHGDLHPKNAIDCGGPIALIDVEDVSIGPAAADLGSMLGALLYLRAAQALPVARFDALSSAFLDGYAASRPLPDGKTLAWYTAAALFVERASRAVTRIRPLGLAWMDVLFVQAERVLDCGWGT